MYIAQAFKGLHDWWRYILGIVISLVGLVLFSVPHALGVFLKSMEGGSLDQSKMDDTAYLMGLFDPNLNLIFILLPFAGGLLFLLLAVKGLHKQTFTSLTTARPKIDWKRFWVIFFGWGILSSGLVLVDYMMSPEDYVFNFNLQHNFDDRQRLNFDLDYFDYFTHQPQDYDNDFYGEDLLLVSNQGIAMDKETPLNIWVAKLDYKIKVNDQLTFETGLKSAISEFNNRIDLQFNDGDGWKINPLFSDTSDFKEKISAAFGSLDLKIDEKTGLKAGLRYEYTDRRLTSNSEGGSSIRQYGNFFPSLFLSRNINQNNSLQFAFSRRITRPTFNQLAPFVLFIEPNTYRTGNPSLRAAITHQFRADYRMKTILFSIQYSVDKDLIASNQPSIDPESNLFVFYSENLDRRETTALTLSLPIYVNDWWEMQNQVTFQHQRLQSEYNRGNINHSKSNANFNTSHPFTAPKGFIIELKGSYRTASIYGVSIREPMGGIDFGLQKSFCIGGFKSEVQHLPTCKVRRCQAPPRTITSSSLKTASRLPA